MASGLVIQSAERERRVREKERQRDREIFRVIECLDEIKKSNIKIS